MLSSVLRASLVETVPRMLAALADSRVRRACGRPMKAPVDQKTPLDLGVILVVGDQLARTTPRSTVLGP